jgi:flagellar biogenesis protein FliO
VSVLTILLVTQLHLISGTIEASNPTAETQPPTADNSKEQPADADAPKPQTGSVETPPPSTWDQQQNRTTSVPPSGEGVTMGMQALKTLFGLGIVLALLFLSSKIVSRKLGTVRWKSKEGRLQVSDFMLLDGKSGVYLVEIDGADWIIVTGPHGTSLAPKDSTKRNFQLNSPTSSDGSETLDLKSASLLESN